MRIFQEKKKQSIVIGKRRTVRERKRNKKTVSSPISLKQRIFLNMFFFGVVGYFGFIGYLLFYSPLFRIEDIRIEGAKEGQYEEVRGYIHDWMEENAFFLGRVHLWAIPSHKLEEDISTRFEGYRVVTVKKDIPGSLSISLVAREAIVVWCVVDMDYLQKTGNDIGEEAREKDTGQEEENDVSLKDVEVEEQNQNEEENKEEDQGLQEEVDEFERINTALSDNETCFFVDDLGKIYRRADLSRELSQNEMLIFLSMDGNVPNEGEGVLPEEDLLWWPNLLERMRDELYVDMVRVVRIPALYAQEATLRTQEGWDVRVRTDKGADAIIQSLRTFLSRVVQREDRENLKWVDLRVNEKIFYATKNHALLQEEEEGGGEKNGEEISPGN